MNTIEEPIEYLIIEHRIFPMLTIPRYLYFLSILAILKCMFRGVCFNESFCSGLWLRLLPQSSFLRKKLSITFYKSSFHEKNLRPDIGTSPKRFSINDAAFKPTAPSQNSSDNKMIIIRPDVEILKISNDKNVYFSAP